jgi:L-seryl-tRNA(Ser) seleniumtransferase
MVEVGATNKTRLSDYESAITPKTALLFKAHKSNYAIKGFAEEVSVAELASLGRTRAIPFVYDIGSGLLRRPEGIDMAGEPDVRAALADGADLVSFSGDKLLAGPQSGIIAGNMELVKKLAKAPLMRALRVGKLTIAALSSVCRSYLDDVTLRQKNCTFSFLGRTPGYLQGLAAKLREQLHSRGVDSCIVDSQGQCGGGSLPELFIKSAAVKLIPSAAKENRKHTFAERLFRRLLDRSNPVLGILREGDLLFDVLAVREEEIPGIAEAVADAVREEAGR